MVNLQDNIRLIFQEIPRGELYPCLEAKRPENKVKNRYTTIHPCNFLYFCDAVLHFMFLFNHIKTKVELFQHTNETLCF